MTAITPFAAGSYVTNRNTSQLLGLKNQLNDLSTQLSSGLTAQTYGGLGSGRSTALAAQATLSALTGYAAGITAAQTRTNVAVTSLTQVATLGIDARNTLNNGLQSTPVDATAAKANALNNLQAALDTLNQSVAGNYLFGGENSSTQPVLDADTILNGTKKPDGSTDQMGLTEFVSSQVKAGYSTAQAASTFFSAPNPTTTAANTVVWYQGENGPTDPLSTQSVQVSAGSSVQIGVRANQPAISNVLAGLATVALGMPNSSDPNAAAIYSLISSQAQPLLSSADTSPGTTPTGALPSVQDTVTQLSLASTRLSNAATTNKATQNTLQNTLDGIEQAPTEEVVAKLLDVQNRLQASYQITSSLSKLSLVNYLS